MDNLCICCGESVPEGRQVCRECETKAESKPKTNRDKLSTMTNEELARWITSCNCCVYYTDESCAGRQCSDGVLKWLEKEAEENGA